MDPIQERARDVGRLIAQTEEYKALKRANERLSDDREAVTTINRLSDLEGELAGMLRSGREPSQEQQREYESLVESLQQTTVYQGVVAAQSNFDRLMERINEEIAQGIQAGDQSRIILP
ncbi:MAG TPA: YlbF family regulator [Longimicrobiaceae bacterium]